MRKRLVIVAMFGIAALGAAASPALMNPPTANEATANEAVASDKQPEKIPERPKPPRYPECVWLGGSLLCDAG